MDVFRFNAMVYCTPKRVEKTPGKSYRFICCHDLPLSHSKPQRYTYVTLTPSNLTYSPHYKDWLHQSSYPSSIPQTSLSPCLQTSCSTRFENVLAPKTSLICSVPVLATTPATNHLTPSVHGGVVKLPLYVQKALNPSIASSASDMFIETSCTMAGSSSWVAGKGM